jgi:cysteine desulfurase / selenocysteine lyase
METKQILNVREIRENFEILNEKVNGKPLIYLDSGATSLTPKVVVDSVNEYYNKFNANIHRGIHFLSERATIAYEDAHKKVGKFLNCKWEEVVFTKNTTESLNLLAFSLGKSLEEGDEILVSEMEHHSNIVPWQELAKEKKLKLEYIKVKDGEMDLEDLRGKLGDRTKIVSVTHVSNVLGCINPIKEIGEMVHNKGALFIVDGAQSVPHMKIDVKDLDVDFFAFSGHKMMGPTGIGVLYGKKELLEKMSPFMFGGDMISEVKFSGSKWNELPWKFEAGTPMIAQGIGLGRAVEFLDSIGMDKIKEYEDYLVEYALEKLIEIEKVTVFGPQKNRAGVISFKVEGVHAHDVSAILDREGVAVRGGHMCAMPLVTEVLGEGSVVRASLYVYNKIEDIDKLIDGLKKVKEIFEV